MVDLYLKIEALIERREDTHARHEDAAVQRIRSQASAYPLSLSYPPIFPRTQFTKTIRLTRGPREYLAPLSLKHEHAGKLPRPLHPEPFVPVPSSSDEPLSNSPILSCHCGPTNHPSPTPAGTCLHHPRPSSLALGGPGDHVGSSRPSLPACLREGSGSPVPDMASADLLRREEEFYSSLFDPAKGTRFLPGRCSYRARSRIGRPNVASFTPSLLKFWCVCAWTQVAASGRGRS